MKPNKLNKILTLLFIFMCSMMLLNDQVKADANMYNGGGSSSSGTPAASDKCPNSGKSLCPYGNAPGGTRMGLKFSIYYINEANFYEVRDKGGNIVSPKYITVSNAGSVGSGFFTSKLWSNISKNVAIEFGFSDNGFTHISDVEKFKSKFREIFGVDFDNLDFEGKDSQKADKNNPASYGFRIIIEPLVHVHTSNGSMYYSVKEVSHLMSDEKYTYTAMNIGATRYNEITQWFYVTTKDVGIQSATAEICRSKGTLKGAEEVKLNASGCGYNIIDITEAIDIKKCYSTTVERNNPVCRNSDRNNIGTYSEKYSEIPCDGSDVTEQQKTNTEYGKLMNSTREDCNIYCIESATTNFPGSISSKLSLNMVPSEGAYFAWPTMRSRNGLYTMSMTSKFTCRIVRKGNSCDTNTLVNAVKSKIESNEMKFGAKLTAGTNRKINTESLVKDGDPIDKSNTSGASNFSNNVSGEITFERTQYLKINGSTNRYYNRVTDATSDSKPNSNDNLKNIFDRKQGVVSLKKNDDTNNDYKLVLSNISLGSNNIFGTDDAYSYVCSYAITNDSCLCPEGSPKSEFDIYHELTEEELKGKTCSQLQQEYCYDNSGYYCVLPSKEKKNITTCVQNKIKEGLTTTEAIDKCTEEDPDCKNICQNKKTGELVNIEDCMNRNNNNYAFCENVYCRSNIPCETCCVDNGDNCEWVKKDAKLFKKKCVNDGITYDDCEDKKFSCPGGEENMKDPTTCFTNGLKGTGYGSIEAALNAGREDLVNKIFHSCQIEVCPSGKKIIYRVIDLNDPFPGKTGNKKTGLTGFSNTGGRSRKPGSNWNSTELVSKKILNARGAKGYKLYTEKQPLYKITLTPSIIKEIRKYNKSTNYSDFTLNCTGDNKSSKCISKFIHEELKQKGTNVVEGLCASITNSGEFDECYGGGN